MDDGQNAEKKPVRLTIFNQTYTVLTADPQDLEELAHTVDEMMMAIAKSGNMDSARVAVLTSLHLADRLRSTERELAGLKERVDAKSKQFSLLLDKIIE